MKNTQSKFIGIALLIVACCLLLGNSVTFAKGPADRITIHSNNLAHDLLVTDHIMMSLLSWEHFVDLPDDIEAPQIDMGTGYEMTREYWDAGEYYPFDKMTYYPAPSSKGGYIYFEGMVNGWSEYDDKWFAAKPEGDAAMRWLIDYPELMPYIGTIGADGYLELRDAATLEPQMTLEFSNLSILEVATSSDGQALVMDTHGTLYWASMNSGEVCPLGDGELLQLSPDGQYMIVRTPSTFEKRQTSTFETEQSISLETGSSVYMSPNGTEAYILSTDGDTINLNVVDPETWEILDVVPLPELDASKQYSGAWDAVFGVFFLISGDEWWEWNPFNDTLYSVYDVNVPAQTHPITIWWNRAYLLPDTNETGGIFVEDRNGVQYDDHWLPDMSFKQVIPAGDSFYGLTENSLVRIDRQTGDILAETPLQHAASSLSYLYLDSRLVDGDVTPQFNCTR